MDTQLLFGDREGVAETAHQLLAFPSMLSRQWIVFDHNYLDVLIREPGGEWRIAVHQAGPANQNPTAWG